MYVQNYKYFKYYLKPLILCKLSAEPPHYVPVLLALESPKEFLMLFWAHCAEAEESAFFTNSHQWESATLAINYPRRNNLDV